MPTVGTAPTAESFDKTICAIEERIQTMQRLIDKSRAAGWPTELPEETVRCLLELSATYQSVRSALTKN
jgi:hypothetical protein